MIKALKKMERFYKLQLGISLKQDNQTKDQKMNKALRKNLLVKKRQKMLDVIAKGAFKLKIKSINKLNHPKKEIKFKMYNRQIK